MSVSDPSTVQFFADNLILDYSAVASGVFYFYDILLTLDLEVEFFWKDPLTGATALFLVNRYFGLISVFYNIFELLPSSLTSTDKSCALYDRAGLALTYLQFVPPAVFSSLRAYALSKNWPLAVLILVLSLVPFGVNMADFGFGLTGALYPLFGCLIVDSEPLPISKDFTIIARTCLITADILLVIVTWAKLYRKQLFSEQIKSLTFQKVLIQNGTIYFIVLFTMNALHLCFALLSQISGDTPGYSGVTSFTSPMTSMLISRFLLDLQKVKHSTQHMQGASAIDTLIFENSSDGTISFASRVVNSLSTTLAGDTAEEESEIE